jgi:hypothetical protein
MLIAHRGNLHGPNPAEENKPAYVDAALAAGVLDGLVVPDQGRTG